MKTPRLSLIIGICTLLYIMSYFHRVTPTILSTDLMADFHISPVELGVFSSATLLAYGVMQLPSGMLTDLLGGRLVLMGLSLATGLGTLWFAGSHNLENAFLSRFLTGAGAAVTVPIVAVLAQWCPPRLFVRVSSFIFGTAGLGGILAAPPLHVLNEYFGWRSTMGGFGVFSACLALVVLCCIPRNSPQGTEEKNLTPAGLLKAVRIVLTSRMFWTLGIWYMMVCGASFCMSTLWWGPYLMQGLGMDRLTASGVVSAISIGVMTAFFTLGAAAGSLIKNLKAALIVCTALVCIALLLLVVGSGHLPTSVVAVSAAVFTGCSSAIGPITYSFMKDGYPPAMAGTAVGIVNMTYPIWSSLLQYAYGNIVAAGPSSLLPAGAHDLALGFILLNCCAAFFFLILSLRGGKNAHL